MAWACRDIIAKAGGLIKNDQPYSEKLTYERDLGFKPLLKGDGKDDLRKPLLESKTIQP